MSLSLIANWKLNGSKAFNLHWTQEFIQTYQGQNFSSIGIAPPNLYIEDLIKLTSDQEILIGSQNVDSISSGAHTGEISANMVNDLGGKFTLIGHSERRTLFYESNDEIIKKIIISSCNSLIPVLCIGETEDQNNNNETNSILEYQIIEALSNSKNIDRLILAYEPVWAIGTGQTPKPQEINSIHEIIKDVVQSRFPQISLQAVLYGGSVNLGNAQSFFKEKEIDGALIGGASLNGKEFALIANIFNDLKG